MYGSRTPFFAQRRYERRLAVVEVVPVQAVLAGGEVNLFAVGFSFAGEIGEEIIRHFLLLRRGLDRQIKDFGFGCVSCRKSSRLR